MSIKQTAEYLELPEAYILKLIRQQKIKSLHDGEQYLVNKHQFEDHLEQLEKYRLMIQEYLNDPLPEDPDIKDED